MSLSLLAGLVTQVQKKDDILCVPDIGKKIPVVLVHGFISGPDTWGKNPYDTGSMLQKLDVRFGTSLYVEKFDWSQYTGDWVDNVNIGGKLARRITCLAASSRYAGGYGKVIIIAHSMGGLAVRFAASEPGVGDDLGLVITIATPNKGTLWANVGGAVKGALELVLQNKQAYINAVCAIETALPSIERPSVTEDQCLKSVDGMQFGSDQLQKLPPLRSDIPVFAIGGNVQARLRVWRKEIAAQSTHTDMIVGLDSAIWGMQGKPYGGGEEQYNCKGLTYSSYFPFLVRDLDSDLNCWHSGLLRHRGVQDKVVERLRVYLDHLYSKRFLGTWENFGVKITLNANGTGNLTWDYSLQRTTPPLRTAHAALTWKIKDNNLVYRVESFDVKNVTGSDPFDLGRDAEIQGMTFTVRLLKPGLLQVKMDESAESSDGIAHTQRVTYLCNKDAGEEDRALRCSGLANFAGEWRAHGTTLKIKADGTFSTFWNNGPCLSFGREPMLRCSGYGEGTIVFMHEQLKATYEKEWYTTWEGDPPPAGFKKLGIVGSTLTLKPYNEHILQASNTESDKMNSGYFCDEFLNENGTAEDTRLCY